MRHRSRDEKQIGETGRRREEDSEAMEIVERVVEGLKLGLAAVARAGVDVADVQAAVKCACGPDRFSAADCAVSFDHTRSARSRTPNAQSLEGFIAPVGHASVQSWQTTHLP